jgi:hypothetical protein
VRAAVLVLLAACGGGAGQPDAAPPPPDAPPVADAALPDAAMCSAAAPDLSSPITAGASDDLYASGPGAWTGRGAAAAPGDLVYVEAYRDLFDGDTVTVDGFENWAFECRVCVFLATGCPALTIGVTDGQPDGAPRDCDALWMLDRGTVTLSAFDTDPAAGNLAGEVTPIAGEDAVRLVQVFATGDPQTSTGYGNKMPGGGCLELDVLSFAGAWGDLVDAGP